MRKAGKRASTAIGAAASALCVLACALALAFLDPGASLAPAPDAAPAPPSHEFVANGPTSAVRDLAATAARAADEACGYETGTVIATLNPGDDAAALPAALEQATGRAGWRVTDRDGDVVQLALPEGMPVAVATDALTRSGAVDFAQPDYTYALQGDDLTTQAMTNDPYVVDGKLWALESIHAYEAWDSVHTNRTVTVAVLDDGFNLQHEDLRDNMIADAAFNAQQNAYVSGATVVTDAMRDVSGGRGHGTHVAGIVSGTANNAKGVAGISYNARVLPVKVFNDVTNFTSSAVLVRAYDYVFDNADKYDVRVINLSLGFVCNDKSWSSIDLRLKEKIDEAYKRGIVTVVSACNKPTASSKLPFVCFPGDLDNVVTVISLRQSGAGPVRADNSNYNLAGSSNATKNISAPGNLIYSTYKDSAENYARLNGTSMATPYVSGVLALMFAADAQLFAAKDATASKTAIDRLYATADDLVYSNINENAGVGWDVYTGWGEVNAAAAVAPSAVTVVGDSILAKGQSRRLALTPAQPEPEFDASSWTWATSNPSVVRVAADGTVTAVGAGTATVTAANGEQSRFAAKTVTVYDLAITGPSSVVAGATASYSLPATPLGTYTWESSDPSVATVTSAGVLTAKQAGEATIAVRLAADPTISATKTVTVQPAKTARVANPFIASAKAVTVKASALKKKAKVVTALSVKNPSGAKLSYKKASGSAKLTVNAKTGKLTVKKGTSKGAYKAKLTITSAATKDYAATKKTVTATVKVK